MQIQPGVALVLLNYNGKDYLKANLPFIKSTSYQNKTVYVVDNASNDGSVDYIRSNHPDVVLIQTGSNLGYAAGYNRGLASITADYFVLLNTDVEVTQDFLEPIVELMEGDESIAVCQPKILSITQKNRFEYAGAGGGWIDIFGFTFARGRIFDEYEFDNGQFNDSTRIFWASGACMIIRSRVFRKLNGFYEHYFMYFEEVDFCWRVQCAGYKTFLCAQSVVYHRDTDKLLLQSSQRLYHLFRNNLIMLHRNLPATPAIWIIPVRILLNIFSSFYFILKGHFTIAFKTTTAHIGYLRWVIMVREKSCCKKSLFSMDSVYKGSLVYQYFIARKRKFNDIVKSQE